MLVFSSTRRLTEAAADAARDREHRARNRPWRTAARWPIDTVARVPLSRIPSPGASERAGIIQTAVVGGPGPLDTALTDDARGWSPTFSFDSRAEATEAVADGGDPILPLDQDRAVGTHPG